eukprot:SM000002S05692  [mRNA]  locus=s2:1682230:1687648:+ [translate_table: standard]
MAGVEDVAAAGTAAAAVADGEDACEHSDLEEEDEDVGAARGGTAGGAAADDAVAALEARLVAAPADYQAHVEYIAALRRAGHLERLRAAREAMNVLYPLAGPMWLEWAQDEVRLVSELADCAAVEALFERGIGEYLHIPLWLAYLAFVCEHNEAVRQHSVEGSSKERALFERALSAGGLHLTEGTALWAAYRRFEQEVLLNESKAREKQAERVRSLYHRQLAVPLFGQAELAAEYRAWEQQQQLQGGDQGMAANGEEVTGSLPQHLQAAIKKAAAACTERQDLEERVAQGTSTDEDRLAAYLAYIALEESTKEPARSQILYERAVAAFPVNHDLWLQYTAYLDNSLKACVHSVIVGAYARAVRNCPWVGGLWSRYLLALERASASEDSISTVFEQALQAGIQGAEEITGIFLTRADYLRRRASCERVEQSTKTLRLLAQTLQRAHRHLDAHFPEYVDRSLSVIGYWAHVELDLAKDLAAARGVWEELIKTRGWMTEAWQQYIAMEERLGNVKDVRSLYKRCYSRRLEGSGTEYICAAWVRSEREHGSLHDYDVAMQKVGHRLKEVRALQQQQDMKQTAAVPEVPKLSDADGKTQFSTRELQSKKRKPGLGSTPSEGPAKRRRENATPGKGNDQADATDEDIVEWFGQCGQVKEVRRGRDKSTGHLRGFAYVEFGDEESLQVALRKDKEELHGRQLSVQLSAPPKGGPPGAGIGHRGVRGRGRGQRGHDQGRGRRDRGGGGPVMPPSVAHRRGGHLSLTGSNTFATPRSVTRPLGWGGEQHGGAKRLPPGGDEAPKSNDDFRKMLQKGGQG